MTKNNISKKKILVCVTGGIAAYKTCSLINSLISLGADIKVVMTESAEKFVGRTTFQALTNHAVYTDLFDIQNPEEVEHIALAGWPDIVVIAPATANTIAKLAYGFADNLLTTIILALPKNVKVVIAPAMNTKMWENPLVQENIAKLKKHKFIFLDPRSGVLACRDEGMGKIADTETIMNVVQKNI